MANAEQQIVIVDNTDRDWVTLRAPRTAFSLSTKASGLDLLIPPNLVRDIKPDSDDKLEQAKGIDLGQTLLNQRTLGALESNIGSSEYFVDGHKIEGHSLFDLVSFTQKLSSLDSLRRVRQIGVGAAQDILSELVARGFMNTLHFLALRIVEIFELIVAPSQN